MQTSSTGIMFYGTHTKPEFTVQVSKSYFVVIPRSANKVLRTILPLHQYLERNMFWLARTAHPRTTLNLNICSNSSKTDSFTPFEEFMISLIHCINTLPFCQSQDYVYGLCGFWLFAWMRLYSKSFYSPMFWWHCRHIWRKRGFSSDC